jgi:methionyl-tRNA formyltransferase
MITNKSNTNKIVFFGTPAFAVTILEELKKTGVMPALIVTAPDKPQGRGLTLTPPPVKIWAQENNIKFIQPTTLKEGSAEKTSQIFELFTESWDLFIVAAYGKIIPENILEIPKHKTLNVHPSLLPKFRGPSPIEANILNDDQDIGVSIMHLDKEMDHGPIVVQEKIPIEKIGTWPVEAPTLENIAAHTGGELLAKMIPDWISGKIIEKEQNHTKATYCKKITKTDGLIDLNNNPYANYLKICAYSGWPGTYFFKELGGKNAGKNIRVTIKQASYQDGQLTIKTVVPEGKPEMSYSDFLRGVK